MPGEKQNHKSLEISRDHRIFIFLAITVDVWRTDAIQLVIKILRKDIFESNEYGTNNNVLGAGNKFKEERAGETGDRMLE